MLLESEIIPQLENELDFDPTPQYLWDDTGGEPPVTLDEMHTDAYNRKYNTMSTKLNGNKYSPSRFPRSNRSSAHCYPLRSSSGSHL